MTTEPNDIWGTLKPRDVALAVGASNRIILEALYRLGANREEIEASYRAKANEFVGIQFEQGAGDILRMMSGTSRPKRAE